MEDRSSTPKLNSTSYTYLGCADSPIIPRKPSFGNVVSPSFPADNRVLHPIAGKLPQDEKTLSKIIGKIHHTCQNKPAQDLTFTLEDLLPPKQQAPQNSPGEFQTQTKSNANFKSSKQMQIS